MAEANLKQDPLLKAKKTKWIIIIAAVVVLLAAMAGGAYWYLNSGTDVLTEIGKEQESEEGKFSPSLAQDGAFYVQMPRPFVFNLLGLSRSYLLQIKVQMQVRGTEAQTQASKHIPLMEDALLSTFSAAKVDELRSEEGKDALRQKALTNVQTTLNNVVGHPLVERVLFTDFVMQ